MTDNNDFTPFSISNNLDVLSQVTLKMFICPHEVLQTCYCYVDVFPFGIMQH